MQEYNYYAYIEGFMLFFNEFGTAFFKSKDLKIVQSCINLDPF